MAVTTGSAGALLRDARTRAGLSQTELARLAGVAQSVVSAYESGRRQPSLSTLARLVAATGSELEITLVPSIPSDATQARSSALDDIRTAIEAIRQHLSRGDLSDGLIFDAVRVRLIEIGKAVKALPSELLATRTDHPMARGGSDARSPCPSLFRHYAREGRFAA
jgi:transcriptional regulator with XRE-family HTH domain